MPTIIQDLYEEITNELRKLTTGKDDDQVINKNLLKKIHCLKYDVYINNIYVHFLNKVEIIKHYKQTVMNGENNNFFKSVIQNFQELKIMTMAAVYKKNPEIWYGWFFKN